MKKNLYTIFFDKILNFSHINTNREKNNTKKML